MITKNLRLPALSVFAAAAALTVASTSWAAGAGQDDSCKAAKARIAANAAAWKDGGACDLSDEDKLAVKPDRYGAALTQFRSIKETFMANFDKSASASLGAGLASLRTASEDFMKQHPERGEMNERLKALNAKIANLDKAVDAMRPSSMTNAGTLHAIDRAMGDLQDTCDEQHSSQDYCPGSGTGALESLDAMFQKEPGTAADPALAAIKEKVHALNDDGTGLGDAANILVRMRRIYNCRASDEQIARDRACTQVADTAPSNGSGAPKFVVPAGIVLGVNDPSTGTCFPVYMGSAATKPIDGATLVSSGTNPAPSSSSSSANAPDAHN